MSRIKPVAAVLLVCQITFAQTPVSVRVGDKPIYPTIPPDFAGLSFEITNVSPDKHGKYFFSPDHTELVKLFRTIGIKNLRVGAGTVDLPQVRIPQPPDIDQLFAFAKAADVRVIYNFRLLNGNIQQNAEQAKYIQEHYADQLECFQIGNEPDWHSFHTTPIHLRDPRIFETTPGSPGTAYPSYLKDWRNFAAAIIAAAPEAKFTGPDTGSDYPLPNTIYTDYHNQSWTTAFARDEKSSGHLVYVTQHDYPGQSATGVSIADGAAKMLSRDWPEKLYPALFNHALAPVQKMGLTYRMTEANDHTGGVDGASNAFASALWTLDYLHWHAAHGAAGVNFHNKAWIFTDTVYLDKTGQLKFNPKAYALLAFAQANHGAPLPVALDTNGVNLTAYAIRGEHELFVTLINKEFGPTARAASVTIHAKATPGPVAGLILKSQNADVLARTGITLGDAPITIDSWNGKWKELAECKDGTATLTVPPASAIVLKVDGRNPARGI